MSEEDQKHMDINIGPVAGQVLIRFTEQGGRVFSFTVSPYDALALAISLIDSSIVARVHKSANVIEEGEE